MAAFAECVAFGAVLEQAPTNAEVLTIGFALLIAFIAVQIALWPLRALRGWRLECRATVRPAQNAEVPSQFTIRDLLGWTFAFAALLAAWRWFAPGVGASWSEVPDLVSQSGQVGLIMALASLPVVALAWLLMAKGSRPRLRAVLSVLIPLAAISGAQFFLSFRGSGGSKLVFVEAGLIANGLLSLSAFWMLGCRLNRLTEDTATSPSLLEVTSPTPHRGLKFVFVLAGLLLISANMASSIPASRKHWRRAAIVAYWWNHGMYGSFDDAGAVLQLKGLNAEPLSDDLLQRISQLPNLKSLDLAQRPIDDRQFALLAPLAEGCLRDLTLRGTNLTDVGLVELGRFERLEVLDLSNTQITDDGLRHLKPLAHLRDLHLMLTETTDAGLLPLGQLPSLESLDVTLTAVSGGGANQFRQAHPRIRTAAGTADFHLSAVLSSPKLIDAAHPVTTLHARGNQVTDAYLSLFGRLADLKHLDMRDTAVTDRGARTLAGLKTLRRLDLRGSAVSQKGISRLTKSLPDCEIVH